MTRSPTAERLSSDLHSRSYRDDSGIREEVGMRRLGQDDLLFVKVVPTEAHRDLQVVICPSFLELTMLQKTEIQLAREAARRGFPVVYVQPPGSGDSSGDPALCTLDTRVRTALFAASELLEGGRKTCFFGARLGAAVAVLAAAELARESPVAIWDPCFEAAGYWRQVKRLSRIVAVTGRQADFEDPEKQMASQGWASMFGNHVSRALLDDLNNLDRVGNSELGGSAFVLSLNERLLQSATAKLHGVTRLSTFSLDRPDVGHLGLRDAPEAVEPTLAWLDSEVR